MRIAGLAVVLSTTACGFSAGLTGDRAVDAAGDPDGRASDASPDAPEVPPDAPAATGRRKRITIADAQVAGELVDFPLWIALTDNQLRSRALADGSDIHFTTIAGAPLPYQLQRWDKATGRLEAWVRVTIPDAGTELFLAYGDAAAAHPPAPATVFAASFNAVWHLDDALANTAIADARGTHPGTAVGGLAAANQVPAKLGGGIAFDGVDDEITFVNDLAGGGSHTFSAWVSALVPLGNSFSSIVTIGNPMTNRSRWFHTSFPDLAVGFYGNDYRGATEDIHGDGFTLLHWVYDGTTRVSRLYRDGALIATSPAHAGGVNTMGDGGHLGNAPVNWGAGGTAPLPLNGILDEVRLATTVRDGAWIAAEFANQSDPATFYTVSNEQP